VTDISGLGAIGRGCSKNLKSGGLEASYKRVKNRKREQKNKLHIL
jgi:hypothetical protein